jgi:hypothetical protein
LEIERLDLELQSLHGEDPEDGNPPDLFIYCKPEPGSVRKRRIAITISNKRKHFSENHHPSSRPIKHIWMRVHNT